MKAIKGVEVPYAMTLNAMIGASNLSATQTYYEKMKADRMASSSVSNSPGNASMSFAVVLRSAQLPLVEWAFRCGP